MPVMSGHSGNEIYCLNLKRLAPGELVLGNSVYSMGLIGGIGAGLRSIVGGEVEQITSVIHDGRAQALERMNEEAQEQGGYGITGVTSELKSFRGNVEFITVGSCVHPAEAAPKALRFTTSANAQELYCNLDAGLHADRIRVRQCRLFDRRRPRHHRQVQDDEARRDQGVFQRLESRRATSP